MDINKEIKSLVKQTVMEEVNNLGVRAAIREKLVDDGITKNCIKEIIEKTIDSYIRSALNSENVDRLIEETFNEKIKKIIETRIEKVIGGLFWLVRKTENRKCLRLHGS